LLCFLVFQLFKELLKFLFFKLFISGSIFIKLSLCFLLQRCFGLVVFLLRKPISEFHVIKVLVELTLNSLIPSLDRWWLHLSLCISHLLAIPAISLAISCLAIWASFLAISFLALFIPLSPLFIL